PPRRSSPARKTCSPRGSPACREAWTSGAVSSRCVRQAAPRASRASRGFRVPVGPGAIRSVSSLSSAKYERQIISPEVYDDRMLEAPVLTTPRLRLRMLEARDFEEYAAIHSDFEVTRFTTRKQMTRTDSWNHMASIIGHWHLRGYGMWAVEELATRRLVGRVGK